MKNILDDFIIINYSDIPDYFNNLEYTPSDERGAEYIIDGSQFLANKGMVLSFQHVPSERAVFFKSFITAFNETYSSDWAAESVYGRADPIYMFKQTQRKITLAFKVPCSTESEAYENLAKVQQLVQFLYPSYADDMSATTITQSPLIRLKVMNLLTKATEGATGQNSEELYKSYGTTTASSDGLLGVINNLTVNHNLENGDIGVIEKGKHELDAILPKMIEINLDFSPIHEGTLGWNANKTFSNENFPYGAVASEDSFNPSDLIFRWAAREKLTTRPFNKATVAKGGGAGGFDPGDGFGWTDTPVKATDPHDNTFEWPQLNQEDGGNEDEGYTPEQDAANAEARYAGLFGNMRYNADVRKTMKAGADAYDPDTYRSSAIRGAAQSSDHNLTKANEARLEDWDE